MRVSAKFDSGRIASQLKAVERQGRFATALALTRTAQDVKQAEEATMRTSLDRPTPYTMRSLYMRPATTSRLEARVWLKDDAGKGTPAEKYLLPQIMGGQRPIKRFERALQRAGLMPAGTQAVPGKGARLDAYGNVSRGQIIQILSQLRVQLTAGYESRLGRDRAKVRRAITRAGGQYFALPNGRGTLPPGVYQRRDFAFGSAVPKAVFLFKQRTSYRPRFNFFEVGQRVIDERYETNFSAAWARARSTARP